MKIAFVNCRRPEPTRAAAEGVSSAGDPAGAVEDPAAISSAISRAYDFAGLVIFGTTAMSVMVRKKRRLYCAPTPKSPLSLLHVHVGGGQFQITTIYQKMWQVCEKHHSISASSSQRTELVFGEQLGARNPVVCWRARESSLPQSQRVAGADEQYSTCPRSIITWLGALSSRRRSLGFGRFPFTNV